MCNLNIGKKEIWKTEINGMKAFCFYESNFNKKKIRKL